MRPSMELKVWVEGIQRIVCGVTEATTCQVNVCNSYSPYVYYRYTYGTVISVKRFYRYSVFGIMWICTDKNIFRMLFLLWRMLPVKLDDLLSSSVGEATSGFLLRTSFLSRFSFLPLYSFKLNFCLQFYLKTWLILIC